MLHEGHMKLFAAAFAFGMFMAVSDHIVRFLLPGLK